MLSTLRGVAAALHGAGEWASTQSMFQALRIWELSELRRVLCLRRRPNESWFDCMKRTGPVAARQLKKCGQMRMQTSAMRRLQQAAWQMAHSLDDAGGRRYWEEAVAWRCDDEWREAYVYLAKDDPKNRTKWKRLLAGRATYWKRSFTRLDATIKSMQKTEQNGVL